MNCQACGGPLTPGVRFCPRCGAAVASQGQPTGYPGGAAAGAGQGVGAGDPRFGGPAFAYTQPVIVPRPPRVAQHIRTLGILWVCFGVYRVLAGLAGMFFFSAMTMHRWGGWGFPYGRWGSQFPPGLMGFLVPVIATGTVISAALAFAAAYGLLNRTNWGRVLAIVAAILALLKFPLGTALGVYTLWVLATRQSGAEYDHLAATTGT